jgi:recombination protein RecT
VVGAYVVVKTDTGDFLTHAMPISAIHKIRDRSPSWKKNKSGPWATDPGEMVKKTVVKQASKYWPRRERLDNAVHHMNTDGGEGIDMGAAEDVTLMVEWVAKANAAESSSALQAVWKEGVAVMQAAKDKAGYAAFKQAVGERGAQIKTQEVSQ